MQYKYDKNFTDFENTFKALKWRRLRIANSHVFIQAPPLLQLFILPVYKFLFCPVQYADDEYTACSDCFREINYLQVLCYCGSQNKLSLDIKYFDAVKRL